MRRGNQAQASYLIDLGAPFSRLAVSISARTPGRRTVKQATEQARGAAEPWDSVTLRGTLYDPIDWQHVVCGDLSTEHAAKRQPLNRKESTPASSSHHHPLVARKGEPGFPYSAPHLCITLVCRITSVRRSPLAAAVHYKAELKLSRLELYPCYSNLSCFYNTVQQNAMRGQHEDN